MVRTTILLAALALLTGCSGSTLTEGRGRYWAYTDARLAAEGYPDFKHDFSNLEWGVLFDDEGVPYGPRSFFISHEQQEHPHLTVTDEYLESRWVRVNQSPCCGTSLVGHFLEILDLAVVDVSDMLRMDEVPRLYVYGTDDVDHWRELSGRDFWVTHLTDGPTILVQPVNTLFQRTLAGHVAYAAVAEAFLDVKTNGRIPRWFREGLSSYMAEEGFEHLSYMLEFRARDMSVLMTPAEVERHVFPLIDRAYGRIARYNAFLMVWWLSENHGWSRVQDLIDTVAAGADFEDAVEQVYGVDHATWLAALDPTVNGEPTTYRPGYDDSQYFGSSR